MQNCGIFAINNYMFNYLHKVDDWEILNTPKLTVKSDKENGSPCKIGGHSGDT